MTQLALLLTLGLIGLVLSFALARLEVRRGAVAPTVKRIEGAIDRACQAVLWRGGRRAALLLLVPGAGLVSASLLLSEPGGAVSPIGRAAFSAVALLAGALSAFAQARLALALGVRACSAATAAAARGSALTLRPLLRASGALAVFGEGLGLLGLGGAFCLLYAVRGGFAQSAHSAALLADVVRLLPAFALGAAVTALGLSREGGALATAALVGGGQTSERESALPADDPRSPATLAELIGTQVGGMLPRALVGYVAGLSATVSAAVLAVGSTGAASPAGSAFGYLLLLLVVRAFGAVGSMCGVFAARSHERETAERALWRGQLSALFVSIFGLAAGLYWLRVEAPLSLLVAGLAGLLVAMGVSLLWLPLRRGAAPARETAEARSLSEGAAIALGAGAGLSSLLPGLLLPAFGLWLLEGLRGAALGAATPAPAALLVAFVSGLIATLPFSLAVAGFGLLSDAAQSVAALAHLDGDRRSSARLDEVSAIGGGAAGAHASLALSASLLLGLFALWSPAAPSSATLGPALSAALAGITLVLVFGARSARSALLGARVVADEVRRQLRSSQRRPGAALPADFTPSYKACVDSALASAQTSSLWLPSVALLVPFALAGLSVALGDLLPRSALLGFAAAAVVCGLVFVLASRATRAALREARQRSRATDAGATSAGALSSFGDLLGVAAATGVEALVGAVALSIFSLAYLLG
ncbi:MAG TPA: sodium/proton-translocating pyrophosphatase, partial [Polyangiaceae bacterium]